MRVAEWCEHTAEVGGDILHYKSKGKIFLLACAVKRKKAERQKRDERHIVCDEHGADEGYVNQREYAQARVFAKLDDLSREDRKKANIAQSTDHREHGKKAGERFEIEISQILFIRWDDERCDDGGAYGYEQHGVFLCERDNLFFDVFLFVMNVLRVFHDYTGFYQKIFRF